MRSKVTSLALVAVALSTMLFLAGCFTIWDVNQPGSVSSSETFSVTLNISTNDTDENAKYGILGLMIPADWTVNSVTYTGDYGPGTFSFLHPDSNDSYPSDLDSGWVYIMEDMYPSGDDMHWVTYEADSAYAPDTDTNYVEFTISFTAGTASGTYGLGYLITEGSTDFSDPGYWDVSLNNYIGVDMNTIAEIQDTTGTGSGDSPLDGEVVTVDGVISAESWAFGDNYYFLQMGSGPWSGIKVYDPDRGSTYGDLIRLTGTVDEYSNTTEILSVTEYSKLDSGLTVEPTMVTTGEIGTGGAHSEMYEGVLVKVMNAEITNDDLGYGEWEINDGTGACRVDDAADYYFAQADYDSVMSLTGVLEYGYGDNKILPRLAYDIVEAGGYIRLQRIQQVRYSDMLKAPVDTESDISYLDGDTVKVKGVVTMPTGLSYAGAGIKFIFADPAGGPWSAILSYHPDSTAYPVLYEGDMIEMSGYIGEYTTGPSNMTEFWITSPINITSFAQPLPPVDTVATGDLRLPVTAEQWGNVMVAVKDAVVTNVNPQYELFAVDDGTGSVLVDDDSDSLIGYVDPPLGAIFESIEGWVYHHYGSYADSSAYKLEPLYVEDLVLGAGPPQLQDVMRDPGVPTSSDAVDVSVDVTTNGTIATATIYYSIDGGAYQSASMSQAKGDIWTGSIPAQSDGARVNYFLDVVDTDAKSSMMPADTSLLNYSYVIRDAGLTIADLQYTEWPLGDSPFNGCKVNVTGVVTGDTAMSSTYGVYSIQNGSGPWNGIFIFGYDQELLRGDDVQVWGTVDDYNADYHYKWDNNTSVLVDSVKVLSSGNAEPAALVVTTADLAGDAEDVEQYEGVFVKVEDAQVTSINTYDWSLDDGSGACLLDDDASSIDTWFDSLTVGTVLSKAQGIFTFSFGTYKIEARDLDDVEIESFISDDVLPYPLTYRLEQNFPNPFNPETRIYFEIPVSEQVTVAIYNILGQKVRTLAVSRFNAGKHVLNWDGRDDYGQSVSTGTYIFRMKAGNFIDAKKMLLIR